MLICNDRIPSNDSSVWGQLDEFDGFRFARCQENGMKDTAKLQFYNTSLEDMHFGYGQHACPGRWFASAEIKSILCFLITHYEIKFADENPMRPENLFFETAIMPDASKEVLFKRIEYGGQNGSAK
jgi:cytochrome P450